MKLGRDFDAIYSEHSKEVDELMLDLHKFFKNRVDKINISETEKILLTHSIMQMLYFESVTALKILGIEIEDVK